MIKITNSMTNKKEEFIPIEPGKIKMYACGITVYDYSHIRACTPSHSLCYDGRLF